MFSQNEFLVQNTSREIVYENRGGHGSLAPSADAHACGIALGGGRKGAWPLPNFVFAVEALGFVLVLPLLQDKVKVAPRINFSGCTLAISDMRK